MSAPLHVGIHLSGLEADTPLGRHPSADTPWTDTPLGRHHHGQTPPRQTPQADTPNGQTPPWADTPLGRHPPGQTHPCPVHAGIHTPLPSACWDTHTPAQCMLGYTPPAQCMMGYGQQAGGMHPTGIHSCCFRFFAPTFWEVVGTCELSFCSKINAA